jgi:hypothetical protein
MINLAKTPKDSWSDFCKDKELIDDDHRSGEERTQDERRYFADCYNRYYQGKLDDQSDDRNQLIKDQLENQFGIRRKEKA